MLAPLSQSHEDEELLGDALSLLAYERPEDSPCGYMLRQVGWGWHRRCWVGCWGKAHVCLLAFTLPEACSACCLLRAACRDGLPDDLPSTRLPPNSLQPARTALAEEVNAAVLAHCGLPPSSALERLVAACCVVVDTLKSLNHPQVSYSVFSPFVCLWLWGCASVCVCLYAVRGACLGRVQPPDLSFLRA